MSRKHNSTYLFIPLLAGFVLGGQTFAATPVAAAAAPATAPAAAPASTGKKTCEDVKADIDAKLKAKGIKTFTLDIVPKADVKDAKVVGSCEAGAKKITYKRG